MSTFWKNRPEGGRRFALWLIRGIARYGGRLIGRALLYPITVYFLVVRGAERRASVCYLSRVLGRPACWLDVARHFHMFASTILDRVYLLCGQMERFRIDLRGVEQLSVYLDRGCGLLIFGSHLGSFEALRALARTHPHAKLRIVLDKAHNRVT
ncbi:acyltransferase, partial [Xylella fastidiosa subsp. fastidiosa Mus-1]